MKAASGDDRMADGKFASRFLQVTAKRQDAKVTIAMIESINRRARTVSPGNGNRKESGSRAGHRRRTH